jgi:hypothetical protein
MIEHLAKIDPTTKEEAPAHFKRFHQPIEDTVISIETANGYRVTLITSLAEAYINHGFINPHHQFLQIISENDPRAFNHLISKHPELLSEEDKYDGEDQSFSPRLGVITGAFFDEFATEVPKQFFLCVTKAKDFKSKKAQYDEKNSITLENGLGRHHVEFSKICPDYYSPEGRGPVIQSNYLGYPIVGHPEKFHMVEVPYLTPKSEPYPNGYDKGSVFRDMVASLANSLEALAPHEELSGLSVIQSSEVAVMQTGERAVSDITFFLQSAKIDSSGESDMALPYTTEEASQDYLKDCSGRSLYEPFFMTDPQTGDSFDLGLYTYEVSDRFAKNVYDYQRDNALAGFGLPTHAPSGTGKMIEIVQVPSHSGEPINLEISRKIDHSKGLTHSQLMRDYAMSLVNGRILSPAGCPVKDRQKPRPDLRKNNIGSSLVATNPQALVGPHFKNFPEAVPERSAVFRYQVKDTPGLRSEMEILFRRLNDFAPQEVIDYGQLVSFHNLRGKSQYSAAVTRISGHILIDINLAVQHDLSGNGSKGSVRQHFWVVQQIAGTLGYWMDRGTVFKQQRVVTSAMKTGGIALYSAIDAQFTRRWYECDGINENIQNGTYNFDLDTTESSTRSRVGTAKLELDSEVIVRDGIASEHHAESIQALDDPRYKNLPEARVGSIKYTFKDVFVPALGVSIPMLNTLTAYKSRDGKDNYSFEWQAVSDIHMEEAKYINMPTFYGEVIEVKDKSGNPIYNIDGSPVLRPKFAAAFLYYAGEEDYRRMGVALKREMRYMDAHQDEIMWLMGYEKDRKESGHDWAQRGKFIPVNQKGQYDGTSEKVVQTDRDEITFEWENRKIYRFNIETFYRARAVLAKHFGIYRALELQSAVPTIRKIEGFEPTLVSLNPKQEQPTVIREKSFSLERIVSDRFSNFRLPQVLEEFGFDTKDHPPTSRILIAYERKVSGISNSLELEAIKLKKDFLIHALRSNR